jgi:hypothetical protein
MDALTIAWKKLSVALPSWAESYIFPEETKILAEQEEIQQKLVGIEGRLSTFEDFKQCLCNESDSLVEHVNNLFRVGFGIQTDSKDEFKQDLTILKENKPVVVVEIKGKNSNMQRDHVNQADSHRERNGLPAEFPALLVMNTFLKASSFNEKDQAVPQDQVKHAVNMNVLIVRTFDLLNLLGLVQRGILSKEKVLEIFQTEKGWLHVTAEDVLVEK